MKIKDKDQLPHSRNYFEFVANLERQCLTPNDGGVIRGIAHQKQAGNHKTLYTVAYVDGP